jgi:hypothetical protein
MRDTTCSVPDVVSRGFECAALCNWVSGTSSLRDREAADGTVNDKIVSGNLCQRYSVDVQ